MLRLRKVSALEASGVAPFWVLSVPLVATYQGPSERRRVVGCHSLPILLGYQNHVFLENGGTLEGAADRWPL